jgi:ethanolamine utilization protein EutM
VAAVAAADAMVKAAKVVLVSREQVGELVSVHVIPRPHAELGRHFTVAGAVGSQHELVVEVAPAAPSSPDTARARGDGLGPRVLYSDVIGDRPSAQRRARRSSTPR